MLFPKFRQSIEGNQMVSWRRIDIDEPNITDPNAQDLRMEVAQRDIKTMFGGLVDKNRDSSEESTFPWGGFRSISNLIIGFVPLFKGKIGKTGPFRHINSAFLNHNNMVAILIIIVETPQPRSAASVQLQHGRLRSRRCASPILTPRWPQRRRRRHCGFAGRGTRPAPGPPTVKVWFFFVS